MLFTSMVLVMECMSIGAFRDTLTPAHQFTYASVSCTVWVWLVCSLQLRIYVLLPLLLGGHALHLWTLVSCCPALSASGALLVIESALRVLLPLRLCGHAEMTRRRRSSNECLEPPPQLKPAAAEKHYWSPKDWQWNNTNMSSTRAGDSPPPPPPPPLPRKCVSTHPPRKLSFL